jgi:hypothetical protein
MLGLFSARIRGLEKENRALKSEVRVLKRQYDLDVSNLENRIEDFEKHISLAKSLLEQFLSSDKEVCTPALAKLVLDAIEALEVLD